MLIDEAIKILSNPVYEHYRTIEAHFPEANQLGIEALGQLVILRKALPILTDTLLPGEDPDDSAQSTFEHEAPKTIYHRAWAAIPTLLPGEDSQ